MNIKEIAKTIEKNGGKLYLVGGALRDKFLNREAKDNDYVVTGITHEKFIKLFPDARMQGKSFEVFVIGNNEIALARQEIKIARGHKGFEIISNEDITIEEDLKRRDITINAIAQEVLTEKIIDPFNGIEDIENGIIRATSSSFKEDPLRVYRVARFAAELNFRVEARTLKIMENMKSELDTLSKERIFEELKKTLKTKKPSIFFKILRKVNVMDIHFKEIEDLIGAIQPVKYHPEGDSFNHTMLAVDNSTRLTKDPKIIFCALVHDLGKGLTPKEMYPHHYNHDKRGIEPLKKLSKRLGIPNDWEKAANIAVLEHMKGGAFYKMTDRKKVDFIEKVSKSNLGLKGLQIVVYADKNRDENTENLEKEEYNFINIAEKMLKEINGDYIRKLYNLEEGELFGNKLHEERVKWMKKQMKLIGMTENI